MPATTERRLRAKQAAKRWWWGSRRPTARWRTLPDFIIFGAQKSGTTSMYNYLIRHDQVRRPFGQEPVFFSHERKFEKGVIHYRNNFPLERMPLRPARSGRSWVTGEASGEYLYYPTAPSRVATMVPEARLILVLRDPVQRCISAYFHNRKLGMEDRSIVAALGDEIRWHSGELEYTGPGHRLFGPWGSGRSYLGRSMYGRHLQRWLDVHPPERMLIVEAERLFEQPGVVMREVTDFLGIEPDPRAAASGAFNVGRRSDVPAGLEEWLAEVFEVPNQELDSLVRSSFGSRAPDFRWA